MVLWSFLERTSSKLTPGSRAVGNLDIFLYLILYLIYILTSFAAQTNGFSIRETSYTKSRMKSISSNSKFLGIVLGRGWEGGDVENIYQEKIAGADEPVGSTIEGWAWMWAKVWRLPNLVLLGQSFSTALLILRYLYDSGV